MDGATGSQPHDLKYYEDQLQLSASRMKAERQRWSALTQIVQGLRALEAPTSDEETGTEAADETAPVAAPDANDAEPEVETDPNRPANTVEAARTIYRDSGVPWRTSDLQRELERRGWFPPDLKNPGAALRQAVKRLEDLKEIQRVGYGTYEWIGNPFLSGTLLPEDGAAA